MSEQTPKPPVTPPSRSELPIIHLLPNALTLAAICAGLTAIRYGFQGYFASAVVLIIVACVLDGIDGKLARLLRCETQMGAELDSLADFVNFGVAAPILIYLYALQGMPRAGWFAVLVFAVCCVIRLARFNVGKKADADAEKSDYFVGVPAPAGALLVMLPMFLSFLLTGGLHLPVQVVALWMVIVGLLMISRIPTLSFKKVTVSRENVKFVLLGAAVLIAALLNYPWFTLAVFDIAYLGGVIWAAVKHGNGRRI